MDVSLASTTHIQVNTSILLCVSPYLYVAVCVYRGDQGAFDLSLGAANVYSSRTCGVIHSCRLNAIDSNEVAVPESQAGSLSCGEHC